jgi:hypothetical protein
MENPTAVGQLSNSGFGDLGSQREVRVVRGGTVELDETTENDALVVGPCCLAEVSEYAHPFCSIDLTILLFLQSLVNPSLMVPRSLIIPLAVNQFISAFAHPM